jgi:hypothetical protein
LYTQDYNPTNPKLIAHGLAIFAFGLAFGCPPPPLSPVPLPERLIILPVYPSRPRFLAPPPRRLAWRYSLGNTIGITNKTNSANFILKTFVAFVPLVLCTFSIRAIRDWKCTLWKTGISLSHPAPACLAARHGDTRWETRSSSRIRRILRMFRMSLEKYSYHSDHLYCALSLFVLFVIELTGPEIKNIPAITSKKGARQSTRNKQAGIPGPATPPPGMAIPAGKHDLYHE